MKKISEKAREYAAEYNGSGFANEIACAYLAGATEALQSQWREFPSSDGFADEDAIDKIALPILVRYQDGYVFTVNHDWSEEAEWYNDILNHPNRYTWLPIPKYEPKGGEVK
ncbi:MAG: hypothetical protein NC548_62850 [Lachnospiraceae bacterium]|nr:hypothetical protein [Lachnospiraceae bacterium]